MHEIRWIRDHPDTFDRALNRRNLSDEDREKYSSRRLITLDKLWRAKILELETAQARRNDISREIGEAKRNKNEEKEKALLIEVASLKEAIPKLTTEERKASKDLVDALAEIPNLPLDDVPDGLHEKSNVERHKYGAKR